MLYKVAVEFFKGRHAIHDHAINGEMLRDVVRMVKMVSLGDVAEMW